MALPPGPPLCGTPTGVGAPGSPTRPPCSGLRTPLPSKTMGISVDRKQHLPVCGPTCHPRLYCRDSSHPSSQPQGPVDPLSPDPQPSRLRLRGAPAAAALQGQPRAAGGAPGPAGPVGDARLLGSCCPSVPWWVAARLTALGSGPLPRGPPHNLLVPCGHIHRTAGPLHLHTGPLGAPTGHYLLGVGAPESGSLAGRQQLPRLVGASPRRPGLRAWRADLSLGRPGPQPGWQGVGSQGCVPRLRASGPDRPGPSQGLWAVAEARRSGLPAARGVWLRKPSHNGPRRSREGRGPEWWDPAVTTTLALARPVEGRGGTGARQACGGQAGCHTSHGHLQRPRRLS